MHPALPLAIILEGGIMVGIIVLFIFFGVLIQFMLCFRKVRQGQAIVRNGVGGTRVSFNGMIALPGVHQVEYMDISMKRIEIERKAGKGLICKDNHPADIKAVFFLSVNQTPQDVLHIARSLGCANAGTMETIHGLFDTKFSEALKSAARNFNLAQLHQEPDQFKSEVLKVIGTELNGFILNDFDIEFIEPLKS